MAKEAEAKIRGAIRELLLAYPEESRAEAAILAAKAAKLLGPDALLAEKMLKKVSTKNKAASKKKIGR